ncbi:MAG: copper-binding protein [Betaproteobacteria bacterium]|nr:copper-binding protein [Betaproteobacteria bacterium]
MRRACALTLAFAASVAAAPFAAAQSDSMKGMDMKGMDMRGMEMKKGDSDEKPHKGVGVVKSADARKGTVTIAHGPVQSLSWPAMTMTFAAKDKKTAESLKPGQNVEFEFVRQGKDYVITSVK